VKKTRTSNIEADAASSRVLRQAAGSRFYFWLLCACIAGGTFAQSEPSPSPKSELKVAFWNIQWFPGRGPNPTRGRETKQIASVHRDIANIDAEVIGMEEVRDFANATIAVEPLRGFKVDVISNFPPREDQKFPQQVAIASRLQPMSAWSELWKSGGKIVPPRGFAFAAYEIAPKQLLLVYALHLKSNRGTVRENIAMREESIHQLIAHMHAMNHAYAQLGNLTWIVGGDFNTSPDNPKLAGEKTLAALHAEGFSWIWQNVPFAQRYTRLPDRRYPPACDDHIFYRGATLQRAAVVNTSAQSSDHRAVEAVINFPTR
jgi:endonuclease/exonuclease/phosphatase (EEP) superfamily protein YafD